MLILQSEKNRVRNIIVIVYDMVCEITWKTSF